MAEDSLFRLLDQDTANLNELMWVARPLLVFAALGEDLAYVDQMAHLEAARPELTARDMVVFSDIKPQEHGALRRALEIEGFSVVLVGKDGGVKLRCDAPIAMADLAKIIDAMPMRQREMHQP